MARREGVSCNSFFDKSTFRTCGPREWDFSKNKMSTFWAMQLFDAFSVKKLPRNLGFSFSATVVHHVFLCSPVSVREVEPRAPREFQGSPKKEGQLIEWVR